MPPTINLGQPDPECDLDYVAEQGHGSSRRHGAIELVRVWRPERDPDPREVGRWMPTRSLTCSQRRSVRRFKDRAGADADRATGRGRALGAVQPQPPGLEVHRNRGPRAYRRVWRYVRRSSRGLRLAIACSGAGRRAAALRRRFSPRPGPDPGHAQESPAVGRTCWAGRQPVVSGEPLSTAMAVQNMLLAAHALGLGTA